MACECSPKRGGGLESGSGSPPRRIGVRSALVPSGCSAIRPATVSGSVNMSATELMTLPMPLRSTSRPTMTTR